MEEALADRPNKDFLKAREEISTAANAGIGFGTSGGEAAAVLITSAGATADGWDTLSVLEDDG